MAPTPVTIIFYFPFNKTLTGGPRTLITLVELIDRNKFYPLVVTQKPSLLVDELIKKNIEVLVYPLPASLTPEDKLVLEYGWRKKITSFFSLIHYNWKLINLMRSRNVKLVWARNVKGVLFIGFAARFAGIPLVWDIGLGDKFQGFMKLLHFVALNLAGRIVTQGQSQHRLMFGKTLTRWYQKKLHFILPGISPDRVNSLSKLQKRTTDHHFCILSIGTISPRKNQKMLAVAAKNLAVEFPFIRVNFVGPVVDEAYYQELIQYISREGLTEKVVFSGWRDDVSELMMRAQVLVVCSLNEGIPRVIHEAMHAQLPVIATKVGGIPDAIMHETTGFLVEENDIESLTNYLKMLIENQSLAKQIGSRANAFAQQNFTYEAYHKKYEQLFIGILRKDAEK